MSQFNIFRWIKSEFPDGQDKEDLVVEFIQYIFGQKLRNGDLTGALKVLKSNSGSLNSVKNQKSMLEIFTKLFYSASHQ
jgi:predicted translin family RNA/ssDNA-binding protein